MTKARDLANASTALSAVSATELAFVDGVTSAIQTQMDAKAPSSTAVTLTGTQTLTNKTLTSPALTTPTISTATTNGDILYGTGSGALSRLGIGSTNQALGVTGGVPAYQASSKSTLTTTGDIMYASAANTPARLGIGTTGQVLNVAGGVPAWATPAGSAMTLISRVSIGNTASVTLDNVFTSSYQAYLLVINQYFSLGATDDLLIRYRTGGSSGTDASTNHYSGSNSNGYSSATITNYTVGTSASMALVSTSDTTVGTSANLYFPFIGGVSNQAPVFGSGFNGATTTFFNFIGYNAQGATYTGLKFLSTSANIYLKASLYGLADA